MVHTTAKLAVLALVLAACGLGYQEENQETREREESYTGTLVKGLERGSLAGAQGDLTALAKALEQYAADHGQYPEAADFETMVSYLSPTYIGLPPERDGWGGLIEASSWSDGFKLIASGPDRVSGTADDVVLEPGGFTQVPTKWPPP